jgi:uncharacterized protein YjbI with pentapeptide repeats
MRGLAVRACALVGALLGQHVATVAVGADLPVVTHEQAYRELELHGHLDRVRIDGEFDLARLQAPAGTERLTLTGVEILGKLHSSGDGPALALLIDDSTLHRIDLRGTRLRGGLAIENSVVLSLARFDSAQFDGPFVLHRTVFEQKATFRRARFGSSVEIVDCSFDEPEGASGGVSFADTRFAGPASFNWSRFASDVSFESSRFEGDASFLGLEAPGRANWRNVAFARDAEFRACRLGEVDFGDEKQMSVFSGLADFRGCTMRSLRLDYVDARGDVMLVNVRVGPGDVAMRNAVLRGLRSDFSGLKVAGALEMDGAHITAPHFRWSEIVGPLRRSGTCREQPPPTTDAGRCSDIVRPLQRRLEFLKQDDEAREAASMLADRVLRERLARSDLPLTERATLWLERIVWGWTTGYGTQLGRIGLLSLEAWLLLSAPIWLWPGLRLGRWAGPLGEAPPRHRGAPTERLHPAPATALDRVLQRLGFSFGLVFSTPGLMLRAAQPQGPGVEAYLFALRSVGAVLLALMGLTLANTSPAIKAIVGSVVR